MLASATRPRGKMKVLWVAGFTVCMVAAAVRVRADTRIGVLGGIAEATLHQTDPGAFLQFWY